MKYLLLFLLLPFFIFSQTSFKVKDTANKQIMELAPLKFRTTISENNITPIQPFAKLSGVSGTIDTLDYGDNWTTNFGFFGQDVMLQWFEAPADMDIEAIYFQVSDYTGRNLEVKLVDIVWTKEQIQATVNELGPSWWGWYPATGNGFNDIEPFEDNLATTGEWVEGGTAGAANNWGSPFAPDLWSDFGSGLPVITDPEDGSDYYWVEMSSLFIPQVLAGDIFGVAVMNQSTTLDGDRAGLAANNAIGITGFKFYRNGRLQPGGPGVGDPGWWTRLYTWDIGLRVNLTGDRPPVINSFTYLTTTISTEDRVIEADVTDDNPGGGPAGVASVKLFYTIDDGTTWNEVAMTGSEPKYSAAIPGQSPATPISYYLVAEDVNGLTTTTNTVNYFIFEATAPALMIYDDDVYGISTFEAFWLDGLPPSNYWPEWSYDLWESAYGAVSLELLQNYYQVYHVMGSGPVNQPPAPGPVYKAWMEQAEYINPRYLFLSGQDYGYISGFADTTFPAGSFEYDYLGVETLGPQDINFAIQDQNTPYAIDAVEADPLTGWIVDSINTTDNFLAYDPYNEIGFANWIDNLTPSSGVPVFTDPNTGDAAVAVRNQGENWKTTFWTVDPLGLVELTKTDSSRVTGIAGYQNPAVPVFEWFDIVSNITDNSENFPGNFKLAQNYPNPFNPQTVINYSLPFKSNVRLTVHDALGREIATLVDQQKAAGNHKISLDGSNLSSGVYFYRLEAGDFVSTRKMILMK